MTENKIAKIVVDTAYHIHRRLGPGLLESVYAHKKLGLLINFGASLIKDGVFRVVNSL